MRKQKPWGKKFQQRAILEVQHEFGTKFSMATVNTMFDEVQDERQEQAEMSGRHKM